MTGDARPAQDWPPAPSDREKTRWYFQRHAPHLPAAGEIVRSTAAGTTVPGRDG
jgi:hypothetical protein